MKGDKVVQLTIGSNALVINGITITMDVNAVVKSGRTMLPVRWVSQALGCSVEYNATDQTVTVQYNSSKPLSRTPRTRSGNAPGP